MVLFCLAFRIPAPFLALSASSLQTQIHKATPVLLTALHLKYPSLSPTSLLFDLPTHLNFRNSFTKYMCFVYLWFQGKVGGWLEGHLEHVGWGGLVSHRGQTSLLHSEEAWRTRVEVQHFSHFWTIRWRVKASLLFLMVQPICQYCRFERPSA